MSEPTPPNAPPAPHERAEAADGMEAADVQVPGPDAPPPTATAAQVEDTTSDPAVRAGEDAVDLTVEVDRATTVPEPPPAPPAPPTAAPPPGVTPPPVASPPPASSPPPPARVAPAGEVEIECPECGMVVVGDQPRPSAEWFCPRCDFPLFWASPPPPDRKPSTQARHRLPGTGGRSVVGAEACWYCGEMNEPGKGECFRCAATIPKPLAPVPMIAQAEQPEPVPVPVSIPTITWPYVAAGVLAGSAVGIAATSWVLGLG